MGAFTLAMLDDLASWECKHEGISMKSILLTSTALVAFAGAAAADGHATGFSLTGAAELGYNTTDGVNDVVSDGFFWDLEVDATATTQLDNGLEVSATFGVEIANGDRGQALSGKDYVLKLSGENASLSFGNLDPVAKEGLGEVDGHSAADFNDDDAHFDTVGFDALLVGEATLAGFTAQVSFGVDQDGTTALDVEDIDAMQIFVSGTVSIVDLEFGYAEEVGETTPETIGLAAGVSVAGADLTVSYLANSAVDATGAEEESSIGLAAAYPVGPVTVSAYYSINDVADDNFGGDLDYSANGLAVNVSVDSANGADGSDDDALDFGIEGSYDVGNGLTVFAGYLSGDRDEQNDTIYAAAEYDLGGGASVLFSYADDGDAAAAGEDLGDPEYKEGLTVQANFAF